VTDAVQARALYDRAIEAEGQLVAFHAWHRKGRRNADWLPHAWRLSGKALAGLQAIRWGLPLALPLWLGVVLPALALREARALRQAGRKSDGPAQSVPQGSSVFLGTSIADSLPSVGKVVALPEWFLALPWYPKPQALPDTMVVIDLVDLLKPWDLWRAFADVWTATTLDALRLRKWRRVLYSYMGFRWHLVRRVLDRIAPSEIWIANHYDRWAVLVDGLDIPYKTMVQHGKLTMTSTTEGGRTLGFGPTPKLSSHWRLLHFSPDALARFSELVFEIPPAEHAAFSLDFDIVDPTWPEPTVLMIGAPHIYRQQAAELRGLRAAFGDRIRLYYRPHPRADIKGIDQVLREVGAIVEPARLFRAAACVSYSSTLNDTLDRLAIMPLFVFDYESAQEIEAKRTALHAHLAWVLETGGV